MILIVGVDICSCHCWVGIHSFISVALYDSWEGVLIVACLLANGSVILPGVAIRGFGIECVSLCLELMLRVGDGLEMEGC